MATHSSIPAWEIPWTEEPNGLQSMGLQRVRHDLATKTTATLQFTLVANARIRIPFYFRPLMSLVHLASLCFSRPSTEGQEPFPKPFSFVYK